MVLLSRYGAGTGHARLGRSKNSIFSATVWWLAADEGPFTVTPPVHLLPILSPTQLDTLPAYLPLPSYFPTFLLLLSTSSLYYHSLSWTPSPRNVNCDSFDSNSDNAAF